MPSDRSVEDDYAPTLAVFTAAETPSEPRTTAEIASTLDTDEETVRSHLLRLVDEGELRSKTLDSGCRLWWRPVSAVDRSLQDDTAYLDRILSHSADYVLIVDETGRVKYNSPPVETMLGRQPENVVGIDSFSNVHPDDRAAAKESFAKLLTQSVDETVVEFRAQHADGSWRWVEVRGVDKRDDPVIDGALLNVRDVTTRKQHEQELRETTRRLQALNSLNRVFREVIDTILEQSTRAEIEETLCAQLAAADSYEAACFAEVEPGTDAISVSTQADPQGVFEPVDVPALLAESAEQSAASVVVSDVVDGVLSASTDADGGSGDQVSAIESFASVPIDYESTRYGVLGIVTDRADAFDDHEQAVLEQLGEVVGHAIATTERQRALLSDEVIEISFEVEELFEDFEFSLDASGRITYNRSVPVRDGGFLVYGTATGDSFQLIETLVDSEHAGRWESVTALSTDDGVTRFELHFTDHPVFSTLKTQPGYVHEAIVEDGTFRSSFHFAPNADIQQAIDSVKAVFPGATLVTRHRTVRPTQSPQHLSAVLSDRLTERQLTALEAAYGAGFFNWPRDSSGEDLADSLGISPSTYHQHLRKAQQTLMEIVFETDAG